MAASKDIESEIDRYLNVGGYTIVGPKANKVKLFYQLRVLPGSSDRVERVVFINGFQAAIFVWRALLEQLHHLQAGHSDSPTIEAITFDNRGVGRSGVPENKDKYSTTIMAQDLFGLMDHVGWEAAHMVGFSMGGMIATKAAALQPERVNSLFCIGISGGGNQAVSWQPKFLWLCVQVLLNKSMRARAELDVQFHFTEATLNGKAADGRTRREVLVEEYLSIFNAKSIDENGQDGQMHAVLHHRVTNGEIAKIVEAQIPVWFVHGRHDIVANPKHGQEMAERFGVPCLLLEGAHLVARENAQEVALLLHGVITKFAAMAARSLPLDDVMMLATTSRNPHMTEDPKVVQTHFEVELTAAAKEIEEERKMEEEEEKIKVAWTPEGRIDMNSLLLDQQTDTCYHSFA